MPNMSKDKNAESNWSTEETTGKQSENSIRPSTRTKPRPSPKFSSTKGPRPVDIGLVHTNTTVCDSSKGLDLASELDSIIRHVPIESDIATSPEVKAKHNRNKLNLGCITNRSTDEEYIKVDCLNPPYVKQSLESNRSSVRRRRHKHKSVLDDTNWKDDTVEDAINRLNRITKPAVVESIMNEVIETSLANTTDAVIGSIVDDVLECTYRSSSDGIASSIINEIIDNLPEKEIEIFTGEHIRSGRMAQIVVKGSTLKQRRFLPYMPLTSKANFLKLFKQLFLPYGFPDSVSADYAEYQLWDSLQAFFSTLTGALTTHSVMKGVGVGNSKATAASAAITWMLRDGTGMIGKIIFASWKGAEFDMDCKKWRFFADILNDTAMFLECILPVVTPSKPLFLLCLSTIMKSLVGVAGGATRAAITQHQAIRGNMADVSAKDNSQESCVNLVASLLGILILMTVADSSFKWNLFTFFVFCHLLCNYRAVKAVKLATLNTARFVLILRGYLVLRAIGSVKTINRHESVLVGHGLGVADLCGYNVNLGVSVLSVQMDSVKLAQLRQFYSEYNYMLYVDKETKSIQVFLKETATSIDIIQAFYHAVLLALGTCLKNHQHLFIIARQVRQITNSPIDQLADIIVHPRVVQEDREDIAMRAARAVVNHDFPFFWTQLQEKGWDTTNLMFSVDEWRFAEEE